MMSLRSIFIVSFLVVALSAQRALADCVSGNCQDGFGKATYTDGGSYEGNFKEGYRHGQGTYTWANKVKYVGNWERGDQNGQGTSYGADGNVIFAGSWNHGQQLTVSANASVPGGSVTSGCISGNCQDGFGTYVFADGDKYEGAFRGGTREGMGTFTWPTGIKYVGQWKGGVQEGQGTQFNADGSVFFDGSWQAGKQVAAVNQQSPSGDAKASIAANSCVSGDCQSGTGKYVYAGIGTYEGSFKDGVRSGQGTFKWNEGHIYTGSWAADKMNGRGTITFSDGRKFDGVYKDGVRMVGNFIWVDGSRYSGSFKDDHLGGLGVLQNADGSWYIGSFENDRRNGQGTAYKADGTVDFVGNWKNDERAPS